MSHLSHRSQLLHLALAQGGYVTSSELTSAGIPRVELSRATRAGQLVRLARGTYRLTQIDGLPPVAAEATDLLEVQLRSPYARPCLISALHLHGLTTTRPHRLQFALPRNRQALDFEGLPMEFFYFSDLAYHEGTLAFPVRERWLTTYTVEKTLVDLLRAAPRLGRELYLEGLKNALRYRKLDRRELFRLARLLRVGKTLEHDLEVLEHDQDH
ncbi:Transcriptional regulator-like protein (plasmid) [Deinococcus gobiensis I-0]|uniref:Transcriptional regulator-like protein n=1 Tax=Deinococcus gobiensis (strain DSM 21396 / JCM 16679 / CGMCC 1.7299 / I-0) TaxID=745776 RepID=H8H289_DEIGI|nr:Transcriptional regulator-like protein [Deinococcus gobiensis I-0]